MTVAIENKTIRRDKLRRHAEKGELFLRCRFHYTDDYAWDAGNDHGRMRDFLEAWMNREDRSFTWEENRAYNEKHSLGKLRLDRDDFETTTGRAYGDINGLFTFVVHGNLVYEAKIVRNH